MNNQNRTMLLKDEIEGQENKIIQLLNQWKKIESRYNYYINVIRYQIEYHKVYLTKIEETIGKYQTLDSSKDLLEK